MRVDFNPPIVELADHEMHSVCRRNRPNLVVLNPAQSRPQQIIHAEKCSRHGRTGFIRNFSFQLHTAKTYANNPASLMNPDQSVRHPAEAFGRTASARDGGYCLQSDLAKLCLPSASRDANRRLAWVNSICFMFLAIGAFGIKAPELVYRPLPEVVDLVPVVFTPPAEPPPSDPSNQPEPQPVNEDIILETPQVATIVAAAESVAFAVPVEGPTILAPAARYVPPPPRELPKATPPPARPGPIRFQPGSDGGHYPHPSYPRAALLAGEQGRVLLLIVVEPNGAVSSSEVKDSSGSSSLDLHAARWVKTRWKFPPGETRYYECEIIFQIK